MSRGLGGGGSMSGFSSQVGGLEGGRLGTARRSGLLCWGMSW